jgi:hypothetical protein
LLVHHLADPRLRSRLVNEDNAIEDGLVAELREEKDHKVRAELRIVDDLNHRSVICRARAESEGVMGMPFAQIVEPSVIVVGFAKEGLQRPEDVSHHANESRERAPLSLDSNVFDAKRVGPNVLAHQYAAYLATASLGKGGHYPADNLTGK